MIVKEINVASDRIHGARRDGCICQRRKKYVKVLNECLEDIVWNAVRDFMFSLHVCVWKILTSNPNGIMRGVKPDGEETDGILGKGVLKAFTTNSFDICLLTLNSIIFKPPETLKVDSKLSLWKKAQTCILQANNLSKRKLTECNYI